jgi:hypothetical protein
MYGPYVHQLHLYSSVLNPRNIVHLYSSVPRNIKKPRSVYCFPVVIVLFSLGLVEDRVIGVGVSFYEL